MRDVRVGWFLLSFLVLACGQSALPGPPQGQKPDDGWPDSGRPPSAREDAQVARPVELAPALPPSARDAAVPVRDGGRPASAPDATPVRRDAGTPAPDEDAGELADAAALDAGQAEPVACSSHEPPLHEARCATEGEVCAHWRTDPVTGYDAYFACSCIAASSSRLVWNCYENLSGSVQCPHERPEDGSSCDGYRDRTCPYPPRVQCACPLDPARLRWECSEGATAPAAPASWPMTTAVRELDEAARQSFCAWYVEATIEDGFPAPPEAPPAPDGYFPSAGCWGCGGGPGFGGMLPFPLPVSACEANLALSECEQPLSELVDCVRSLLSECWPSPRGCARYLEAPGCSGTLVVNTQPSAANVDCRIKVR